MTSTRPPLTRLRIFTGLILVAITTTTVAMLAVHHEWMQVGVGGTVSATVGLFSYFFVLWAILGGGLMGFFGPHIRERQRLGLGVRLAAATTTAFTVGFLSIFFGFLIWGLAGFRDSGDMIAGVGGAMVVTFIAAMIFLKWIPSTWR